MENRELLERIVALYPLASKDETRYHICGVRIKASNDKKEIVLEVTDGHRASIEALEHDSLPELLDETGYLIDEPAVNMIKIALKAAGKYVDVDLKLIDDSFEINLITKQSYKVRLDRESASRFPNINNVWPKDEGQAVIGLNAKYILEIAKALNESKDHNVRIIADLNENGKTIKPLIISNSSGRKALLMPVRI